MIVDSHTHVFPEIIGRIGDGPTRGLAYGRVRIGDRQTIQTLPVFCRKTAFTAEALLANMDWAGVDKAVLLQGSFYGECNAYALDAVRRYPDRLAAAAYIDPWSDNARQAFDRIAADRAYCGIKLECSEAAGFCGIYADARLDAQELEWLWPSVAQAGKVLILDLGAVGSRSYQTAAVRTIARTHPALKIVIAHLGQPGPASDEAVWLDQLNLGSLPNVWFDTASLVAYTPEEIFPFATATRYMRTALDRIGPAKILWGTDIPGTLTHATYPQFVTLAKQQVSHLPLEQQAMVLGGNALALFGQSAA